MRREWQFHDRIWSAWRPANPKPARVHALWESSVYAMWGLANTTSIDILPRPKGRGFLLDGDVFMPGMNTMARGPYATLWHGLRAAKSRENVDCGVHVAVMMGSTRGTRPFSDTQPCSTFRTATRNVSAA